MGATSDSGNGPILVDIAPIDLPMLRAQRVELLALRGTLTGTQATALVGISNLLYAICNQAVKIVGEEAVFGTADEDGSTTWQCAYCGAWVAEATRGVFVDASGGDVCSGNSEGANENQGHTVPKAMVSSR